jgi:hypothetical protein
MPKKSKKDEPCYTRTNKAGQKYTTCEGEQKRNKKLAKEIKTLTADTPKSKPKATPKPKKKVETAEEAYKRHLKEYNNPKKYPDAKLKEFLENIKNRPKDFYKDRPDFENSDKGALRAITQILRTRNPTRDYRRVDPSLFKPRKGDLVLKS